MLSKLSTRFLSQASRARVASLSRSTTVSSVTMLRPAFAIYSRSNSTAPIFANLQKEAQEGQSETAPSEQTPKPKAQGGPKKNFKPKVQLPKSFPKIKELLDAKNVVEAAALFIESVEPTQYRRIMSNNDGRSLVYSLFQNVMLEHRSRFVKARNEFSLKKEAAAEKVAKGIATAEEKELAESSGYPLSLDLKDGLVTPHALYAKLLEGNVTISWMCSEAILWDIAVGKPNDGLEIWVSFVETMDNLEKINEPRCRPAAISAMSAYIVTCLNENSAIDSNIALQLVPIKEMPDDTAVFQLFSNSNVAPSKAFSKSFVQNIQTGLADIRFNSLVPSSAKFLDSLPSDQPLELERRYQECIKKAAETKTPLPESVYARFIGCFAESAKYDRAISVWQDMIASADYTPTIESWNMLFKAVSLMPKNPVLAMEGLINKMQESGVKPNSDTYGTLMHAYFKDKNPEAALELFTKIENGEIKVPVTLYVYNVMLTGLMTAGWEEMATNLLKSGKKRGLVPDIISFNIFISKYLKQRRYTEVNEILDMMRENSVTPNVPTFTNFIDSIFKLANEKGCDPLPEVEQLMRTMNGMGMRTNVATLTAIIDGVSKSSSGGHGANMWLYRLMQKKNIRPNAQTFAALINGEILAGEISTAAYFFNEMRVNNVVQNAASYNQFFRAFCARDMIEETMDLFRKMIVSPHADPNRYTYTFALRACIKASRMDYAREIVAHLATKPKDFTPGDFLAAVLKTLGEHGVKVPKFEASV